MRLKEMIFKITSHPCYLLLDKLQGMDEDEFTRLYAGKNVYPYRFSKYRDNYSDSLYQHRLNNLLRQIPKFSARHQFTFGIWGECTLSFGVHAAEWPRGRARVEKGISVDFLDHRPSLLWNLTFTMPDNFDLDNPIPWIKKELAKHFYPEGILARIQRRYNCDKKETKWYRKNKYTKLYREPEISEDKILKWIKKHFNFDSYVDLDQTIAIVNKCGRQEKLTKIEQYDHSWIFDFDGDVDELESEFWDTIEDNTMYV